MLGQRTEEDVWCCCGCETKVGNVHTIYSNIEEMKATVRTLGAKLRVRGGLWCLVHLPMSVDGRK